MKPFLAVRSRRLAAIAAVTTAATIVAAPTIASGNGGGDAKPGAKEKKGEATTKVKVMTRNVYLGADLTPAIEAEGFAGAIDAAGVIYNEVGRTSFPERAVPLAAEIASAKPHLVGLQEVALWREQTPSDLGAPPTGFGAPATDVRYDFLKILKRELRKAGARYEVVGVQQEFDAELPADVDGDDSTGGFEGADLDARLTMRDVILARKGVETKKVKMANYDNRFEADVAGRPVPADRGWLSAMAKVKDSKPFKFVNTHLEAFDAQVRKAQAKELIEEALKSKRQVVLVGDINSGLPGRHNIGPDGSGSVEDQLAFKVLKKFGMKDRGAVQSCCYPSALDDPAYEFDHTVDHVLVKPGAEKKRAFVTGNDVSQMTPSGLWPSDHGGVVSHLLLPAVQ